MIILDRRYMPVYLRMTKRTPWCYGAPSLMPMSGSTTLKRVWCFTTSMARKEWPLTTKSAPEAFLFLSEKVRFMYSDHQGLRRQSAQIQDGNRTCNSFASDDAS